MEKTITVYVVKSLDKEVNFPTKSKANEASKVLKSFSIDSTIETVKKVVNI